MTRNNNQELAKIMERFNDGSGYGDPEARRNDELKVQFLIAQEQLRTNTKLNWITMLQVVVGFLGLAYQVWGK